MNTIEEDIKKGIECPHIFASYWTTIAFEELRATKHALWMARAMRALTEACYYVKCRDYYKQSSMKYSYGLLIKKWQYAERKCLAKAKEFE